MALYAIGDLHLGFQVNKPMDIFGPKWQDHVERLRDGLSVITEEDTTVLLGDLSWAMGFDTAVEDFRFIDSIPGEKIILKGNHDYWWTTLRKFENFCQEHGFSRMRVLNNASFDYGEIALCGTRGWFYEEERHGQHDEKVFKRELIRLETSLKLAGEKEKYCFLHYPPKFGTYHCDEILELLQTYGVTRCYYGHLHGDSHKMAFQGFWGDTQFFLAAADYLDFKPIRVL